MRRLVLPWPGLAILISAIAGASWAGTQPQSTDEVVLGNSGDGEDGNGAAAAPFGMAALEAVPAADAQNDNLPIAHRMHCAPVSGPGRGRRWAISPSNRYAALQRPETEATMISQFPKFAVR